MQHETINIETQKINLTNHTFGLKNGEYYILRGDNIRLATPLNQVKPGSFFQKELNYLFDKGYKVSSDGHWLTK